MTPCHQAAIVVSAQDWAKAQTRGGDRRNQHGPSESLAPDFDSIEQRATAAGVSRTSQQQADAVASPQDAALAQTSATEGNNQHASKEQTGGATGLQTVASRRGDQVRDQTPGTDRVLGWHRNWLADGFHRYHAFRAAGIEDIPVFIRNGTRRDAVLYSVGANAHRGLRRTNEDKRKAVPDPAGRLGVGGLERSGDRPAVRC